MGSERSLVQVQSLRPSSPVDFGLSSVLNELVNTLRVKCWSCGRLLYRSRKRINESRKFRWKTYCSKKCQRRAKSRQRVYKCSRSGCDRKFRRAGGEVKKAALVFCSHSCSAKHYNAKKEKRVRVCSNSRCDNRFIGRRKYCSLSCIPSVKSRYTRKVIIEEIQLFEKNNDRIPTKRDLGRLYKVARKKFGTWNNATIAAGFVPNPVLFSRKFIANDGHKCDSLSEKIIDDWFYARKIEHKVDFPYPGNQKLTVDFKVADYWIEFFGLSGQLKSYDRLRRKKLILATRYNLKLIEIFPNDIYSQGGLENKLQNLA